MFCKFLQQSRIKNFFFIFYVTNSMKFTFYEQFNLSFISNNIPVNEKILKNL